jgi:putative ABC transport system substrate-binding protein
VDVIAVPGPYQARAAKAATSTIPIVLLGLGTDPAADGLVASFARPGGNVTGLVYLSHDLLGKRLELLKEAVPGITRVALLVNSEWPTSLYQAVVTKAQADAARLGMRLQVVPAREPADLAGAFAAMTRERAEALMVPADSMFSAYANIAIIVQLAAKHRLPTMYDTREYVDAGGLMTYAANLQEIWRRAAGYVDRILKGTKPADLPVEQPTKFEFVINLKTAKALGLTIPPAVLARTDEIIQ